MRIMIMSDLHYSRMAHGSQEMIENRDHVHKVILDHFLNVEADWHVSLGDLTHEGDPVEFRDVFDRINRSGRQFINVIGNHDAYSIPKADIMTLTGQQRYYAIETDEAVLLVLDTAREMNRPEWGGVMDQEQLAWLQDQLESSGSKPVLVFAHHPIFGTTARSGDERYSIHPGLHVKDILHRKKGFGFYFCGHNHVNSTVKKDGWHFIQTATCRSTPAFRVVEIENGQVNIELVYLNDKQMTDRIAGFKAGMPGFTPGLEALEEEAGVRLQVNTLASTQ